MNYPELNGKQWIAVQMKCKGEKNWRDGMFYINRGLPVFASYGSDITEKVVDWRYVSVDNK